jgi:hypothetical protein
VKRIRAKLSGVGLWFGPVEITVQSSAMESIYYDRRRWTMKVTFNSGKTYEYGSVPPQKFREFMQSDSKGRFFSKEIRSVYPFIGVAS